MFPTIKLRYFGYIAFGKISNICLTRPSRNSNEAVTGQRNKNTPDFFPFEPKLLMPVMPVAITSTGFWFHLIWPFGVKMFLSCHFPFLYRARDLVKHSSNPNLKRLNSKLCSLPPTTHTPK